MRLRAYAVKPYADCEWCEVAIAESAKEAKKMAWDEGDDIRGCSCEDNGWIDVTVRWLKNAYIDGLEKGMISDELDGLKREMYSYVEAKCPICGTNTELQLWDFTNEPDENDRQNIRFVSCSDCCQNFEEGNLKKEDFPKEAIPYKDLKEEKEE